MKNHILPILILCLAFPFLLHFAMPHESLHFGLLSADPRPAATDPGHVRTIQAGISKKMNSGKEGGLDWIALGNKQINFWIP
jgi:hypothetical protein